MNRTNSSVLLEICTASVEDVLIAESAGADRVELNSALGTGGLTPSPGVVRLVTEQASIPVIAMARPRESGFCYSKMEFDSLLGDVEWLLENGVQGIAFGVLDQRGRIDRQRCQQVVNLIGSERDCVFHRAFDLVEDKVEALRVLMDCGVSRVMTSGGCNTAWQGRETIREMIRLAGDDIEILPAGGIRPEHASKFVRETGATRIHAGLGQWHVDDSYVLPESVNFYSVPPKNPANYRQTNAELVREMVETLNRSRHSDQSL